MSGRPKVAYISADGSMQENKGWGVSSLSDGFWGAVNLVSTFFSTLVSPGSTNESMNAHRKENPSRYSQYSSGGGGSGSGRRSLGNVAGFGSGAHQIPMATG